MIKLPKTKNIEITVLGGGHGGFATAAHLSLLGYKVNLYTHPLFSHELILLKERPVIEVKGVLKGSAKIRGKITTDIEEALKEAAVVIFALPAFAQESIFQEALPHLREDQIILLTPGNYGSLALTEFMRKSQFKKNLIFTETQSLIYATRKIKENAVRISGIKTRVLAASFPAKFTAKLVSFLKKIFPQLIPAQNVLEVSMNNPNPILHPAITLFNLTRVEEEKGNFKFYGKQGITPKLAKIIEEIDKERLSVMKAWGLKGMKMLKIGLAFYGLKAKTIYQLLTESPIHKRSKGPESLNHRYITEDVPFGLVPILELAKLVKMRPLTIDSIIHLASVLNQVDYRFQGRNLKKLGLMGMNPKQILIYLEEGK